MPTYEMTAPNGLTYRIDGPAGATDAQVKAKILAQHPEAARAAPKPKAKSRQRGTGIGALDTTLDVINEALIGIPEGAYNAAAMITDPIAGLIVGKKAVKKAQKQRKEAVDTVARTFVTKPRPIAREIGRTVAPAAGVTRAASLAAPVLQKAPVVGNALARIAAATASGGVGSGRTAAQTAQLTRLQRAKQLGERVVGGAISGGATAGLMGQDVVEGAGYGAGLPVVLNVLKRVGSPVVDFFRPGFTMAKGNAAQILRRAFADNLDAARAEFARLSPDDQRMAEQFLVDVGVEPRAVFGLGKIAQEQTETGADLMNRALEGGEAARRAALADISGGTSMEEIRAAERAGRKAVTREMAPIREEMYRRSGYANEFVPARLDEAAELERLAAERSGLNRRMILGAGRAEKRIGETEDFYSRIGDEFRPEMVSEDRGIAGAMTQRGEKAGLTAITARERAQDIYDEIDDLAAEGMKPIPAAPLIASLERMLAPGTEAAVDTIQSGTIRGVIRKLKLATEPNGNLNPRALGKIRRSEIGNLVTTLTNRTVGMTPAASGTARDAASLAIRLRGMIDNTLRSGGAGDLVDEFITKSEQGYAAVNRGRLAGEAFLRYKASPETGAEFLKLVGGGDTRTVAKIMGGGPESESFTGAFAEDPYRLGVLQRAENEIKTLNRMKELRGEGIGAAGQVMAREKPGFTSRGLGYLFNTPAAPIALAAEGARRAQEGFLMPRVEKELVNAFVSAPRMGELLNTFPARQIISEQISRRPYSKMAPQGLRNLMVQGLVRPLTAEFPEIDPETGEALIEVTFDEYGRPTPVYGTVSR
jgi:hypothetical protein